MHNVGGSNSLVPGCAADEKIDEASTAGQDAGVEGFAKGSPRFGSAVISATAIGIFAHLGGGLVGLCFLFRPNLQVVETIREAILSSYNYDMITYHPPSPVP